MAQIDEIKTACARLSGMGWQNLLKRHGLDITKADLAAELSRELAIDRSVPGFEDFTLAGKRDIEPGLPAASLLYHADFVFSRTGIARVGTISEVWDGQRRRFRGDPPGQSGIAVTPARYAAFLAEARRPLAADPIMGRRDERNDPHRTFLFPVHKLFSGKSCVAGATITLDFIEYHRNEKLKRIHSAGGIKVAKGFDIAAYGLGSPFPEDAKLCAALNSFWPAVAPDASCEIYR
jgi:hypothetical protein